MDIFIKVIGSVVFGWFTAATLGLAISHTFYDGEGEQIPIILTPIMIVAVFIGSFFLPKQRY
jgi:hypothetical protein